jgi:CheY-like chemotaxis protein
MIVLVVDDNADAAETLAMYIQMLGHETHATTDSTEVVNMASALHPDVILLDLGMPKPDGYDIARQIRAQAWGQSITLIALSGRGEEADKQRTRDAGFNDHLVKSKDFAVIDKIFAKGQSTEKP